MACLWHVSHRDGRLTCTGTATLVADHKVNDLGGLQALRITIGTHGATNPSTVTGSAGDMLVDWVRGYTQRGDLMSFARCLLNARPAYRRGSPETASRYGPASCSARS